MTNQPAAPDREAMTAALVEHRLSQRTNVRNAAALRALIRRDIEQLDEAGVVAAYQAIYAPAGTVTGAPKGTAKDYAYSRLDHAITDAAMMLGRIEGATGERCHTDRDIQVVLTDSYGADLAGKAFALALDDSYAVAMPRYTQPSPTPIDQELVTYGEYLRRGGTPPQADPGIIGT